MSSNYFGKRLLDITFSLIALFLVFPLLILLIVVIRLTSKGPAIHWSKRIGRNNNFYLMPKLRSMHTTAPQLATDLLYHSADKYITSVGKFIRKSSLDELPQLWSVLVGDMSLVGPRPALFNQDYLKELRTQKNVHLLLPGITGWAQINGRDNITDEQKTSLDAYYLENMSFRLDIKIIFSTVFKVFNQKNITH